MSYAGTPRPQLFNSSILPSKTPLNQSIVPTGRLTVPGTPLLLPRAILPRDRSVLDKMVDYLVGDGPGNRYALICKNCSSHNGKWMMWFAKRIKKKFLFYCLHRTILYM